MLLGNSNLDFLAGRLGFFFSAGGRGRESEASGGGSRFKLKVPRKGSARA